MPTISVIIPNYNHAHFLKQRIDSVLMQTYQDFEVIILDDCSTDNSRQIIEEYRNNSKISNIIYNKENTGSTFKQWEKGIGISKGEYIWIAESDDFCLDSFLENAVNAMDKNDNASLFFCQSASVDSANKVIGDLHWWTDSINEFDWNNPFTLNGKDFVGKALIKKNVIVNASAVLMRKKNIQSHLSKIRNYKMCGDWLFWALLLQDNQIIYSSEKMNFFRTHDQTTRDNLTEKQKLRRVVEEISVKQQIQHLVNNEQTVELESTWNDILSGATLQKYFYLNSLVNLLHIKTPKFYKNKFFYYSLKRHAFKLLQSLKFKKEGTFFIY